MLDQSWGLLAAGGASAAGEEALARAVERAGFSLTAAEVHDIVAARRESLASVERIELGAGVSGMLAEQLGTSSFASQESFARDLLSLQGAFYRLRDELPVAVADDDVARFLVRAFDEGGGSIEAAGALTAAEVVSALEEESVADYEPDAAAGMSARAVAVLDVDDIVAAWHAALARLDEHVARTMELHARVVATLPQLENLALWDTLASIRTLPCRYDTRFAAHEVAAEIDYQLQVPVSEELLGIDYVDAWLARLLAEAQQLAAMDTDTVRASLNRADPEWKYSVANLLDLLQVGQG